MEKSLLKKDFDLSSSLTFKTKAEALYYAEYSSHKELERISRMPIFKTHQIFHLGGGSNVLFHGKFIGLVLHSTIKGIQEYSKNDQEHFIIAGAGEKWEDLVNWTIDHGYAGMECLAGIPGEVGAAPVQNVGAYGVEAKDLIFSVECFDVESRQTVRITNKECNFSYRDSRFKHDWKNKYFVLRVCFKLKKSKYSESLNYESLKIFARNLDHQPTTQEIKNEVLKLRNKKLPDITKIGSAGSFFKNPIVHKNYYNDEIIKRNPEVPCYEVDYRRVKIPAGWLIEHSGLKGKTIGGAEIYPPNCLVIVNRGDATSTDIKRLSELTVKEVRNHYGITLQPEVNIVDTAIEVRVLGTGTSKGIPEIGCDCQVCLSKDVKDKRLRSSILVKTMGSSLLIDASPDFRQQALSNDITQIDALLLTHIHYDHVGGMDDLRPFCLNSDIPVYCKKDVETDLKKRIDYCFKNEKYPGVPGFETHIIDNTPFLANGIKIIPVNILHGDLPIVGFRIGDFAYITDCKHISDIEKDKLKDLKVLMINALRDRDHFAHLTIEEAVSLIQELNPQRAYLTHLCHEAGKHEDLENRLPENIHVAYDGQTINIL